MQIRMLMIGTCTTIVLTCVRMPQAEDMTTAGAPPALRDSVSVDATPRLIESPITTPGRTRGPVAPRSTNAPTPAAPHFATLPAPPAPAAAGGVRVGTPAAFALGDPNPGPPPSPPPETESEPGARAAVETETGAGASASVEAEAGPSPLTDPPEIPVPQAEFGSEVRPLPAESNATAATPILSLESAGPASINVGKAAKFTLTVKNLGKVTAEGVQIRAVIPPQAQFVGSEPPVQVEAGGQVQFLLGDMRPADIKILRLELKPRETGPLDLRALASFSFSSRTALQVRKSALTITCAAPEEARFGEPLVFRLKIANVGDGPAEKVVLRPQLPAGAVSETRGEGLVQVGLLPPGRFSEIPFRVLATGKGTFEAKFIVSDDSGAEAHAQARVQLRRATVEVVATGPKVNYLNREGVYEVRVTNTGDSAAEQLSVVQQLPPGLHVSVVSRTVDFAADENRITWRIPHLAAGAAETLLVKAQATQEGDQAQEVAVGGPGGVSASARHVTQIISRPAIQIAVASDDGPLAVNAPAEFQVTLKNAGTRAARDVRVKVVLPPTLRPVASLAHSLDAGGVTFAPLDLGSGEQKTVKFRAEGLEPGDHSVRVIVESSSLSRPLTAEGSAFFYGVGEPQPAERPTPPAPTKTADRRTP